MFDTETFNDKVSLEFTCVILLLFTNPIDGLIFIWSKLFIKLSTLLISDEIFANAFEKLSAEEMTEIIIKRENRKDDIILIS